MDLSFFNLWMNTGRLTAAGIADWGGLHPIMVHFPIALLFFAPLLILIGLIVPAHRRGFFLSALVTMLAGSMFMQLSVITGNAAAEALKPDPAFVQVLDAHVQLAERSRLSFFVLTGVFVLYSVSTAWIDRRCSMRVSFAGLVIFLLIYLSQLIILFNTAHYGARLVHQHGLRSSLFSSAPPAVSQ